ncbi:MAG TPA: chromate efflux transporter [Burkholderiales bacterium]|nr:chromate efflux transporter [Burkholderiales bacterium]
MREIALAFLKIGLTAYGGMAAIWGVLQADLQEKRGWLSRERFLEGLALVNMLPGATAVMMCVFVGHARAGWRGGLLAGLCFIAPAFVIMLALTAAYGAFGALPAVSGALQGLGPVVLVIFLAAVWRLSKTAVTTLTQLALVVAGALAAAYSALGTATIVLLAGAVGVALFHSRAKGALALAVLIGCSAVPMPSLFTGLAGAANGQNGLVEMGAFFLTVGALSFGGGLSMIAFIQEQVVNQYAWLTQREFIDGLALGQVTPGPILMVSAYVGYKIAGLAGAALAYAAIFLPAFVLMLGILPVLERVRRLQWTRAAVKGISPAVIGVLLVTLGQMAPHAVSDAFGVVVFALAGAAVIGWKASPIKAMLGGALAGALRERLAPLAMAPR